MKPLRQKVCHECGILFDGYYSSKYCSTCKPIAYARNRRIQQSRWYYRHRKVKKSRCKECGQFVETYHRVCAKCRKKYYSTAAMEDLRETVAALLVIVEHQQACLATAEQEMRFLQNTTQPKQHPPDFYKQMVEELQRQNAELRQMYQKKKDELEYVRLIYDKMAEERQAESLAKTRKPKKSSVKFVKGAFIDAVKDIGGLEDN